MRKPTNKQITVYAKEIFPEVASIIDTTRRKVAVYLNAETTLLYWNIGTLINKNITLNNRSEYGAKILATLSQQLSWSQWFAERLHRAVELTKNETNLKELISKT